MRGYAAGLDADLGFPLVPEGDEVVGGSQITTKSGRMAFSPKSSPRLTPSQYSSHTVPVT